MGTIDLRVDMFEFEDFTLWQAAFDERQYSRYSKARDFFRDAYLATRERVAAVVGDIPRDIEGLTVHDVTHLDALWGIGSTIAGPEYPLNPAEGYVLGSAFLLHDAGMTLLAYPHGIADFRVTDEWRDAVTAALRERSGKRPTPAEVDDPPEPVRRRAVSEVLRALHGQRAANMPFQCWHRPGSNTPEYLIPESSLRDFYGPLIGRIAASHHLPVPDLETLLGRSVNAFASAPSDWTVDPIKLAGLLRCADAAHIDANRAPQFLFALRHPQGISEHHWNFQNKVGKPVRDGDALVFTSGPDFTSEEADAWWLCFDTIRMIDRELHETDTLFEDLDRCPRFAAQRVKGSHSPQALAEYIRPRGWRPIDTQLRVSDVPRLVTLMGGAHLYGNDKWVGVRELVQNATDAIRARRTLESRPSDYGEIAINIARSDDGVWLSIEDNGIGMSQRILIDTLLDFGKSLWDSEMMRSEFPGLIAKGMAATGKFGIGFFSVFMLADFVRVTSRRYDAALESTKVLEFRSGLQLRPILRDATREECLPNGGTRISLRLKDDPYLSGGMLMRSTPGSKTKSIPLRLIMGALCPNVDASLAVEENGERATCVSANDWRELPGGTLLSRLRGADDRYWNERSLNLYAEHLRPLLGKDDTLYGRAAILGFDTTSPQYYGWTTVGGLRAARLSGIGGILLAAIQSLARDRAIPIVPAKVLADWATEQANLIAAATLPFEEKLRAALIALQCGDLSGVLPFALRNEYEYLNAKGLGAAIADKSELILFDGLKAEWDDDECHPREFDESFSPDKDVLFVPKDEPTILHVGEERWPQILVKNRTRSSLRSAGGFLRAIVKRTWGNYYETRDMRRVGTLKGSHSEITRYVTVLTKNV